MDGKACNWYDCNTIEISCKAKVPRQRTLSRPPPRPCTVTTAVAAPVGTGAPALTAPARVECLGSGAPSTTYKPRGPDRWRIPNLDRSTVFYRPDQTITPSPPVGNERPAVSASDAGGVELQPRPLGAMSGGEGQAGWACELASQLEIISKHSNVQSQSRLWACGWAVVVPRWI